MAASSPVTRQDDVVDVDVDDDLRAELVAVVTAVLGDTPVVLTTGSRLPSGPLRSDHRSMQAGLSAWVEQQTGHQLGYVEQLYTFADGDPGRRRAVSVSYLGLTRTEGGPRWRDWYDFFPWEDHRSRAEAGDGAHTVVEAQIRTELQRWVSQRRGPEREARGRRAAICFGLEGRPWAPELALQRYELLYEMDVLPESRIPRGTVAGDPLEADHRRILATALSRLRSKIQYRPVVFELMPEVFTLGQLQRTVEALAGQPLHKQNFRRLVTGQELVEETGERTAETGGRPARLYRFRRAVLDERQVAGTKLPAGR